MSDILILIIAFILAAFVAGNNLPACTGSIIASKMVSRKNGILIAILGYLLGLVLEGKFMSSTISLMLPHAYILTLLLFVISILLFVFAYLQKIPQSLSIIFTSSIIGIDLASNIKISSIFLIKIFSFWFLIPIASIFFSFILMKILYNRRQTKNIWTSIKIIKVFSIIASFLTAFTFGANTIGLLSVPLLQYSYSIYILMLGIIFGSIFLNKQVLKRISNDILPIRSINSLISQASSFFFVEIATIFGIPLSTTEIFVTSLYGTAFSYKYRLLLKKTLLTIIFSWLLLIFLGIASAFLSVKALGF